jgi:hypothetical protein
MWGLLQLVERAQDWAKTLGINSCVHFRVANATLTFDHLMLTYPGPLQLVTIQWCACCSVTEKPGMPFALLWFCTGMETMQCKH